MVIDKTKKKFRELGVINVPFAPSSAGFMQNMTRIKNFVKGHYGKHWEIKELQRDEKGVWRVIIGKKTNIKERVLNQLSHLRN